VRRLCERELAGYKRPRTVLLYEGELPRNPTGKLLKRELRPWAAERCRERESRPRPARL
jgi:fatty-acyl-CoA synthase